jgi:lipopolysaccharide export system permease protein
MMAIYSKYIQKKLFFYFVIIYCVFVSIIWLTQSLRFLELITSKGIDLGTFLNVTGFLILPMSYICIPLSMFFACIATFSNLESSNELVILKGSGISNMQLYHSIIGVIALVLAVHLSISLYLLPKSYQGFKDMQHFLRESLINAAFEEGVFNTQNNAITVYVDEKVGEFKYKGIFIYDLRNKEKPVTVMANYGELIYSEGSPGFVLYEGNHQLEDKSKNQISLGFFKSYNFGLKLVTNENDVRAIDVNELFMHELLDETGKSTTVWEQHIVHAVQRIIWPMFNLILPLIVICIMVTSLSRRTSSFIKQLKVGSLGIAIVSALLVLNNLSLKHFDYIYLSVVLVVLSFVLPAIRVRRG